MRLEKTPRPRSRIIMGAACLIVETAAGSVLACESLSFDNIETPATSDVERSTQFVEDNFSFYFFVAFQVKSIKHFEVEGISDMVVSNPPHIKASNKGFNHQVHS